ncbi:MAG: cytochrome c [Bauldia sp.]
MRTALVGGLLTLAAIAGIAVAGAQAIKPSAERGRAIAVGWCADCHVLAGEPAGPRNTAPSFAEIAQRFSDDTEILAAIIAYPHPPMRNIGLKRDDVRDLLAFIAAQPRR